VRHHFKSLYSSPTSNEVRTIEIEMKLVNKTATTKFGRHMVNEAVSLTRAITQFSDALCKLTVDMVDVAIDVAEAEALVVVVLAHVRGTSSVCVGSIVPERAQFSHQA
jgi:hypothetical protein